MVRCTLCGYRKHSEDDLWPKIEKIRYGNTLPTLLFICPTCSKSISGQFTKIPSMPQMIEDIQAFKDKLKAIRQKQCFKITCKDRGVYINGEEIYITKIQDKKNQTFPKDWYGQGIQYMWWKNKDEFLDYIINHFKIKGIEEITEKDYYKAKTIGLI